MRRTALKLAAAAGLFAGLTSVAMAQPKNVTIGVSIPAATHGWTGGVVYHAQEAAKQLEKTYPGLKVVVKTSPDGAVAGECPRRSDGAEDRRARGSALQF